MINSLQDFEIEFFSLITDMKVDPQGSFQISLKKKMVRKQLEPELLERKKIYPMMTLCDSEGKLNWPFLQKCERFIRTMEHNFRVLNQKDPHYENLKQPEPFDSLHRQNIYQSLFSFQKMIAVQNLDPEKHKDVYN